MALSGARPRPPTRSRGATGTTTGGPGSTPRGRAAPSPAGTPATTGPAGRTICACWPTSGSGATGSRWSGAGPSPRRASSPGSPSTTIWPCAPAAGSWGWSRWSPSTTSPPPAGWPRPAAGARRRPPSGSPPSAASPLAAPMARACTLNEPNVVATAGYLDGRFPPGEHDPDRRQRANEVFADAHARATAAIKEAADVPVGLTLAMSDDQAVAGGEDALAAHRAGWEDPYLAAAPGDDFDEGPGYSAT